MDFDLKCFLIISSARTLFVKDVNNASLTHTQGYSFTYILIFFKSSWNVDSQHTKFNFHFCFSLYYSAFRSRNISNVAWLCGVLAFSMLVIMIQFSVIASQEVLAY
jgi:hypothetical protein